MLQASPSEKERVEPRDAMIQFLGLSLAITATLGIVMSLCYLQKSCKMHRLVQELEEVCSRFKQCESLDSDSVAPSCSDGHGPTVDEVVDRVSFALWSAS